VHIAHALSATDTLEYLSDRVGIDYSPPTKSPARLFSF
jgi:hypothetical protein